MSISSIKGSLIECKSCLHGTTKIIGEAKPYSTSRSKTECHFSHNEINKHTKDGKCLRWVQK